MACVRSTEERKEVKPVIDLDRTYLETFTNASPQEHPCYYRSSLHLPTDELIEGPNTFLMDIKVVISVQNVVVLGENMDGVLAPLRGAPPKVLGANVERDVLGLVL
jgi:hypothetical protein